MNIWEGMKKWAQDLRLKRKMMIVFCALLSLSLAVVLAASFFVFQQYDEKLYENTSQILNMTAEMVESDLDAIEQAGAWTATDEAVQGMLRDSQLDFHAREPVLLYSNCLQRLYDSMNYYFSKNAYVDQAAIWSRGEYFSTNREGKDTFEEHLAPLMELALQAKGKAVYVSTELGDNSLFYVREIRNTIDMNLDSLGLLLLKIDFQKIVEDRVKDGLNLTYQPQITIYDRQGKVLLTDLPAGRQEAPFPLHNEYRRVSLQGEEYFASYATYSHYGLTYALYLPIVNLAASLRALNIMVLFTAAGVYIVCLWFCSRLVSHIVWHFEALVKKMHLFQEGRLELLSTGEYADRKDELGYLHRSFDEMAVDFRRLVEDNYLKQLSVKDAQIKALQAQINPHFLFNVLQTIHWRAKAAGQEDISQITEALGKILRYTLKEQGAVVPLKKELEIARYYVYLQKCRYRDRLHVKFDVPDTFLGSPIPSMGLQTLLENSIKYALESMLGPCWIRVCTREEDGKIILSVEDNGPGIDASVLERPEPGDGNTTRIGLKNLRQRILLLFGESYGIQVCNTGHGTKVELTLPRGE